MTNSSFYAAFISIDVDMTRYDTYTRPGGWIQGVGIGGVRNLLAEHIISAITFFKTRNQFYARYFGLKSAFSYKEMHIWQPSSQTSVFFGLTQSIFYLVVVLHVWMLFICLFIYFQSLGSNFFQTYMLKQTETVQNC